VVIDALGLVRKSTPYLTKSVLVTDIPAMEGKTVYVRIGDVFAWLCLLVVALFIGLGAWHWYQAKRRA
jgi:apolipoprotein N-acyltransferase